MGAPQDVQDAESVRRRNDPEWEPEWIFGLFVVRGACTNPACGEIVLLTGRYGLEPNAFGGYSTYYTVEQFTPPPAIMTFTNGTPADVQDGVTRAARLLYVDPASAANALRATVERFLTNEGILGERPQPKKPGQMLIVSAHERIEDWRAVKKNDQVADLFLAVKWLGNEGSHEASHATVDSVLEGVTFLERAFRLLYDTTGHDIDVAARAVNARRGR